VEVFLNFKVKAESFLSSLKSQTSMEILAEYYS